MELSGITANETRDQFLQLLVTQLQNQDPLEPTKQEDFLSQLAQFSTLEGIENLNNSMERQVELQSADLQFQSLMQAATLVGRKVEYNSSQNEIPSIQTGVVSEVRQRDGEVTLQIGTDQVGWQDIRSVSADSAGVQEPTEDLSDSPPIVDETPNPPSPPDTVPNPSEPEVAPSPSGPGRLDIPLNSRYART